MSPNLAQIPHLFLSQAQAKLGFKLIMCDKSVYTVEHEPPVQIRQTRAKPGAVLQTALS